MSSERSEASFGDAAADHDDINPDDSSFATADTVETCQENIGLWLERIGIPGKFDLLAGDRANAVVVLNCVYELLERRQQDQEEKERLRDMLVRARSDEKCERQKCERLERQLEEERKKTSEMHSKKLQYESAFREDYQKVQRERDELQRKCASLEQQANKLRNDVRRTEAEYDKLHDKYKADIERRARIVQQSKSTPEPTSRNRRSSRQEQVECSSRALLELENTRLLEENESLQRTLLELRRNLYDRDQVVSGVDCKSPLHSKLRFLTSDPPIEAIEELRMNDQNESHVSDVSHEQDYNSFLIVPSGTRANSSSPQDVSGVHQRKPAPSRWVIDPAMYDF